MSADVALVQKEGEEPVPVNVIAQSIVRIDKAVKRITRGGLNRDAIVTLLARSTNVTRNDIQAVLNGLDQLRKRYTTL